MRCPSARGILILSSQTSSDLRERLATTQMALEAAEGELAGLHARLVVADRLVVG